MNPETLTAEHKLKLSQAAIYRMLNRIRREPQLRELIGAGTEAFNLLTTAAAALSGEPLNQVMDYTVPGSSAFPHRGIEECLAEL